MCLPVIVDGTTRKSVIKGDRSNAWKYVCICKSSRFATSYLRTAKILVFTQRGHSNYQLTWASVVPTELEVDPWNGVFARQLASRWPTKQEKIKKIRYISKFEIIASLWYILALLKRTINIPHWKKISIYVFTCTFMIIMIYVHIVIIKNAYWHMFK